MELLLLFLTILVVGSIIAISMISFRVAITSLLKVNLLEEKLKSNNQESSKQEDDLHCQYSGLPSPKAYENN